MDGLAAVQARIASIETRIAAMSARAGGAPVGTGAPAGAQGSFELALASALGVAPTSPSATAPGAVTPANRLAPGEYGRLEPPADLVGYGNGRIPGDALAPIGVGQHRLWGPAADGFRQLLAAAAADGVEIGVTDSYRSYDAQVRLAEEKGLYSQGGLAATPGTSNHGWGLALDLDLDDRAQGWMREHGWRFGFVEDVPREPWHWTFRPAGS